MSDHLPSVCCRYHAAKASGISLTAIEELLGVRDLLEHRLAKREAEAERLRAALEDMLDLAITAEDDFWFAKNAGIDTEAVIAAARAALAETPEEEAMTEPTTSAGRDVSEREAAHPRTYSLVGSPHLYLVTDDESGINLGYADRIGGPLVQAVAGRESVPDVAARPGIPVAEHDLPPDQAAALTECRARVQRKIDLMREREPIDDRRPGWYWDGWHAALDAIEEILVAEPKP